MEEEMRRAWEAGVREEEGGGTRGRGVTEDEKDSEEDAEKEGVWRRRRDNGEGENDEEDKE